MRARAFRVGRVVLTACFVVAVLCGAASPTEGSSSPFILDRSPQGITRLMRAGDTTGLNFIRSNAVLGPFTIRVRGQGASGWQEVAASSDGLSLRSEFVSRGKCLLWELSVRNTSSAAIEIGDWEIPLPMNTAFVWDNEETFVRRVFRHAFIAGSGSFLYWLPVKGTGDFLVMLPNQGTRLESFDSAWGGYGTGGDSYSVFIHSLASAETEPRGTWRQTHTSRMLAPGEEARHAFSLHWTDSYQGVRDVLFANGGVDVQVAPGMTIPQDLEAHLALRTQREVEAVEAEFPGETEVQLVGEQGQAMIYRTSFRRLGENLLTVHFRDGGSMLLEYFVTQPLETLMKKRASFIVQKQQHRDPGKWYDGLFSLWDQRLGEGENLLGPDHLGGQPKYAVSGSDDPCNGKSLLVAEKNVAYPDADEIEALEYFLKNFVWGKHQRTDQETPFPYGIYGSDSWYENRFTDRDPLNDGVSRPGGSGNCKMWRTYDYTTYFALYYNMYRIARQRPDLVRYLDAQGYLERAYGTAKAYFEVPAKIFMTGGWTHKGWVYWQYTTGNFHEKYLLPLIAALEAEGESEKAGFLRGEWEKKVKYFIYDDPWPFVSEMPFDSTAYESTYAAANYALTHSLHPDTNLWFDRNLNKWFSHPDIDHERHWDFLERQHAANLACRGVLEANYWSLGSDFRGCGSASYTLSYMSQMGGWSVLDYALRHDLEPAANLRLGYASTLSSWALMNAGDEASHYGYWKPGRLHDGSMGWGFQPRRVGTEWNEAMKHLPRGAWPVCGEIDHGLVAGIETARTVVFEDPVFGWIALGGELAAQSTTLEVVPRDGVRQRFSAILGNHRLHIELDRDGFASGQPLRIARDLSLLTFLLENRGDPTMPHQAQLTLTGLPAGTYRMSVPGGSQEIAAPGTGQFVVKVPLSGRPVEMVELARR